MSLVKRTRRGTLFVVVGAQRIECALLAGGHWLPETVPVVKIVQIEQIAPIDSLHHDAAALPPTPVSPLSAVTKALAQIETRVAELSKDGAWSSIKVREIRVLIADRWLCLTSVPWSSALKTGHTADAFARAQLAAAGFNVGSDDIVALDDAPYAQPRLIVAYPAALLSALGRLGESLDARLASVLPLSVAAWSALPQSKHGKIFAMALLDEGTTTVAFGSKQLTDVSVRRCDETTASPDAVSRALSAYWQRMQLRDPQLAQVVRLPVLNLSPSDRSAQFTGQDFLAVELPSRYFDRAPSPSLQLAALSQSRHSLLDAQPPMPTMTITRWAMASVAFAMVGFLALQALQTSRQVQDLAAQAANNNARAVDTAAPRSTTWSREELIRVQAVNTAVRELNLPISALMRALQPPLDIRVALLSVEVMGGSGSVNASSPEQTPGIKIVAEARTGAEMARYVGFVGERKPFAGAYLTHHEINQTVSEHPYRFTLEATWANN